MAGFFRGLRDFGTTGLRDYETSGLRDIAGDACIVSLARFPGILRYSQAFPAFPSKSRAPTSRATNYSHPTLASLPPRTTERTNKRTPRSLVRPFARSLVRLFARSLVRSFARSPFARSLVRSFARSFGRSKIYYIALSVMRSISPSATILPLRIALEIRIRAASCESP